MRIRDWSSDVCSSDLVVDEVHKAGGVIFPQLWHQGVFRVEGTGPFPEATSCRPSGIWGPPGRFSTVTPEYITRVIEPTRAMTESEIAAVVARFARSANNAPSVGFRSAEHTSEL